MKLYSKAQDVATRIVNLFRDPASLPAAIAPVFIQKKDDSPCRQWSWANQLMVALMGFTDARGFRQWEKVDRQVKKGEKSFPILVPLIRNTKEENEQGEEEGSSYLYGFKSAAVFGLTQTEGEPLPDLNPELTRWMEDLPLLDVAKSWGLDIQTFNGAASGKMGSYSPSHDIIALGVENLSTWAHELIHAADDRVQGGLKGGQQPDQEIVAELGGAILLTCLGYPTDADLGGAWLYVKHYAEKGEAEALTACQRLLNRTCNAVNLLLETAESLVAA